MKRVKIVLSGCAATSDTTTGSTRFIHGVCHGVWSANRFLHVDAQVKRPVEGRRGILFHDQPRCCRHGTSAQAALFTWHICRWRGVPDLNRGLVKPLRRSRIYRVGCFAYKRLGLVELNKFKRNEITRNETHEEDCNGSDAGRRHRPGFRLLGRLRPASRSTPPT